MTGSTSESTSGPTPDSVVALLTRLCAHLAWADTVAATELESLPPGCAERGRAEAIYAHLASVEHSWFARLVQERAQHPLWPALTIAQAHALAQDTAAAYAAHISRPGWVDQTVTYANTSGTTFSNRVSDVLAHVALHGSYHRGQLALLARQGAGTPALTDYIAFLRNIEPTTLRT